MTITRQWIPITGLLATIAVASYGVVHLQGQVQAPTGVDADATGEAEVEFAKTGATRQEVEFDVRNVEPGASFSFVIDGVDVSSATSDRRGRAGVELDVRLP